MSTPEEVSTTIQMYEEMFSYRYTADDPEYKARSTVPSPPCVSNYWCKRRNYDQNRGGRGKSHGNYSHDHGHSGGYGFHGDRRGGHRGYQHDRGRYGDRRQDRYHPYNQGR